MIKYFVQLVQLPIRQYTERQGRSILNCFIAISNEASVSDNYLLLVGWQWSYTQQKLKNEK